jgi:hypothetical protein
MKSTNVYKLIRQVVQPWTKQAGFMRTRGSMLGYVRPSADGSTFETFWFQCSRDGWDPCAGSKFTLEFQKAPEPGPGQGNHRSRFNPLLSAEEREQVRSLQNVVIRKLQPPPREHWVHTTEGVLKRLYLARFDEYRVAYRDFDDVWMRYGDEADVRRWAEFLLPLLPRLLEQFNSKKNIVRGGI